MSLTLTGDTQLLARFKSMGNTSAMLREVGLAGVAEAKALVPRRTGNLGRSIRLGSVTNDHVEITAGGSKAVGYAAYVEFGTRGGQIITPVRAKVLAWGGPRTLGGRLRKGGKATNFARRVKRGSTRAQPFLLPGLRAGLGRIAIAGIIDAWNRGA